MKISNLDATQYEYVTIGSKYQDTYTENTFANCVIANDAAKKLDFLFLVIKISMLGIRE